MCNLQRLTDMNDFKDNHSAPMLSDNNIRWGGIWYKLKGQSMPLPEQAPMVQQSEHKPEWKRLQEEGIG